MGDENKDGDAAERAKANGDASGRTHLPFDLEAEIGVLGSILLDNRVMIDTVGALRPEHFAKATHRELFAAMVALHEAGREIDFVTLRDELLKRGALEKAGGIETIVSVAGAVPSPVSYRKHVAVVKEKASRLALIDASEEIMRLASEYDRNVNELVGAAEARILAIADRNKRNEATKLSDALLSNFEAIEAFHRKKGKLTGLPTGFYDLDALTDGLRQGELVVVGGRSSTGKTTFCLNIADHVAVELRKTVLVFSYESSREQLAQNLICSRARIDAHKLRHGEISEADWKRLPDVADRLADAKVFITEATGMRPLEIAHESRLLKKSTGLDLVIIDYLQLVHGDARTPSREEEVASIVRSFKELAHELNVPVILTSQVSRRVDSREDHRPRLMDLDESGQVEECADTVLLLFREERYRPTDLNRGITDVYVAKRRGGPTGSVKLNFMPDLLRFGNLAYTTSEPAR